MGVLSVSGVAPVVGPGARGAAVCRARAGPVGGHVVVVLHLVRHCCYATGLYTHTHCLTKLSTGLYKTSKLVTHGFGQIFTVMDLTFR